MEEEIEERLETEYKKDVIKLKVKYKDIRTYDIEIELLTSKKINSKIECKYNVKSTFDNNIEYIKAKIDLELSYMVKEKDI